MASKGKGLGKGLDMLIPNNMDVKKETKVKSDTILKLSEIEIVKKSIHNTPVLLLDDVLSELDSSRQNYLLNSISDIQTIITCTGLEEFVGDRKRFNHIFHVVNGMVSEQKENKEDYHEISTIRR